MSKVDVEQLEKDTRDLAKGVVEIFRRVQELEEYVAITKEQYDVR